MSRHLPYKTREGGATVTVFVPYDCRNNCPFCINKQEYADMTGFSLEKICESITLMDGITPKCDFVFTGGEPFADIDALQLMLDRVPTTHRVFINTTLPVSDHVTDDDIVAFTERNKGKINCINISRHMQHFVMESNDSLLARLAVPFRINCVLFKDYPKDELIPYMERFLPVPGANIQFRYDYTNTTPENLYERDHIFRDIKEVADYIGLDGCRMRCGFHFIYKGMRITYHRTLPYSTVIEYDATDGITYNILYDILIKQTGEVHADWGDQILKDVRLDIDAYRNVKFEPDDMRWIERI